MDSKPSGAARADNKKTHSNASRTRTTPPTMPSSSVSTSASSSNPSSNETNHQEYLPFLVTHWLAHFGNDSESNNSDAASAVKKIRRAAADIASAFSTLGAFGTVHRPSFSSFSTAPPPEHNATYSDVSRQWSRLPPSHLHNILHAVGSSNAAAHVAAAESARANLVHAAGETSEQKTSHNGRTLNDAIVLDEPIDHSASGDTSFSSSMDVPISLSVANNANHTSSVDSKNNSSNNNNNNNNKTTASSVPLSGEKKDEEPPMLSLTSKNFEIRQNVSQAMIKFLDLRFTVRSEEDEIRSLEAALSRQEKIASSIRTDRDKLLTSNDHDTVQKLAKMDELKETEQNCIRVVAQLRRRLSELEGRHQNSTQELANLKQEAHFWHAKARALICSYRDPLTSLDQPKPRLRAGGRNTVLRSILSRQQGIKTRFPNTPMKGLASCSSTREVATIRKTIFCSRLSHAATVNCHLNYPVYCLRFDRTGRYFITGADDYLTKVFYLGAAQSCNDKNVLDNSRDSKCNYGANARGAILVCTLRGHAGVINDIDVSTDNCFLATASVDGDCRIWGLKDGCPVAILRGHKGGANMVSWSTLTPYRLVTTGADGYARMWDIREATLKRYGAIVAMRPEYQLRLTEGEKRKKNEQSQHPGHRSVAQTMLPPLPIRESRNDEDSVQPANPASSGNTQPPPQQPQIAPPPVPPIPAGGEDQAVLPEQQVNNDAEEQDNNISLGQFVANDQIDEGVKLLTKFKHGITQAESIGGPGTRARRKSVNVICVARCPLGGSFATGSDDGICRVWEDNDDKGVEMVDSRGSDCFSSKPDGLRKHGRFSTLAETDCPLMKLMGHVSAITDLAYSNTGDRIMGASQKDGVIRIWSLGTRFLSSAALDGMTERSVPQIVIKLTNPATVSSISTQSSRQRRPRNSVRAETSKVSCDVAAWTPDGSKIISSQSILVKQSDTEIQPGSQFLFLWDSRTGQCLLGISGAHSMQCPVVIPHPTDPSLVCTAAADGMAKLWDWESGRCVFEIENKVEFGPMDSSDRNKISGYLDGSFSPDGSALVLTDDCGRITVIDCLVASGDRSVSPVAAWMREQYFANDYYELFYDTNGYCIERGSEQPPHLAPKGVRCNHSGTPWSDVINETFRKLRGPMPLPVASCRWRRQWIRSQVHLVAKSREQSVGLKSAKVRRGVREFDPLTTIMIKGGKLLAETHSNIITGRAMDLTGGASTSPVGRTRGESRNQNAVSRELSNNFRWGDYDDLMQDGPGNDDDEVDSDDEEFEPAAATSTAADMDVSDGSEDFAVGEVELDSPYRAGRRGEGRQNSGNGRRLRAQRRAQRRDSEFVEVESDDDVAQYVSTNHTPSGPYVRDYTVAGHLWRLTGNGNIRRRWLRRDESDSSYAGRKTYTPQVGDSVVYIPRAHCETIKEFPSLTPPWQRWPQGTAWPVVRCCIRELRFRFPYEDYYRTRQTSIVAILTLEVTGIPELSEFRDFPWPKPSFVAPTRSHLFELSIFENDKCEFVIPEVLYKFRLESLEAAFRLHDCSFRWLSGFLNYANEDEEDVEMNSFKAVIKEVNREESVIADAHLNGSGFGVVSVDCQGSSENVSPWDLIMNSTPSDRPRLSHSDKVALLEALDSQKEKPSVKAHLYYPVDQERYSDYSKMVEIPMDIKSVETRIRNDYYSSKLGAVMDVRLIRDNCVKYNGTENDLSRVATVMYEDFVQSVLSRDERDEMLSEDEIAAALNETAGGAMPGGSNNSLGSNQIRASRLAQSRARDRTNQQSTFDSLLLPSDAATQRTLSGNSETQRRVTRSGESTANADVLGRASRKPGNPTVVANGGYQKRSANDVETLGTVHIPRAEQSASSEMNGKSHSDDASNSEEDQDCDEPSEELVKSRSTRRSQRIRKPSGKNSVFDNSENEEDIEINPIIHSRSMSLRSQGASGSRRSSRTVASSFTDLGERQIRESSHSYHARESRGRSESNARIRVFAQITDGDPESTDADQHGGSRTRSLRSRRAINASDVSRNDISHSTHTRNQSRLNNSNSDLHRTRSSTRSSENRQINSEQSSSESEGRSEASAQDIDSWHGSTKDMDDESMASESSAERGGTRALSRKTRSSCAPSRRPSSRRAGSSRGGLRGQDFEVPSPTRRSSRKIVKKESKSYADDSSDSEVEQFDSEDEELGDEVEEEEIDEEEEDSAKPTRNRRSAKKGNNYAEIPSDYDEDSFEESSTESRIRRPLKRARAQSGVPNTASKRKKLESYALPATKPWPKIDIKDITKIANAVVERIRELDVQGAFAIPVEEAYPGIRDEYRKKVSKPMDLRTIEEDRIHRYREIQELQEDLRLMFSNCCSYNRRNSTLFKHARDLWEKTTDAFREACKDMDILLPRRF